MPPGDRMPVRAKTASLHLADQAQSGGILPRWGAGCTISPGPRTIPRNYHTGVDKSDATVHDLKGAGR